MPRAYQNRQREQQSKGNDSVQINKKTCYLDFDALTTFQICLSTKKCLAKIWRGPTVTDDNPTKEASVT